MITCPVCGRALDDPSAKPCWGCGSSRGFWLSFGVATLISWLIWLTVVGR